MSLYVLFLLTAVFYSVFFYYYIAYFKTVYETKCKKNNKTTEIMFTNDLTSPPYNRSS